MSLSASERYQQHPVWTELAGKIRSIREVDWNEADSKQLAARDDVLELLSDAARTRKHPQSGAFLELLTTLQQEVAQITVTPTGVHNYRHSRYAELARQVRGLPAPGVNQLSARYAEALDRAVGRREADLTRLGRSIAERKTELAAIEKKLDQLNSQAASLSKRAADSAASISAVAENGATTVDTEWKAALSEWQSKRDDQDKEDREKASAALALLAGSAHIGEQLLAKGGGNFAANEWKKRAVRERKSGLWMRRGAVASAVLGVAAAAFFILTGKSEWFASGWENVPLRLTLSLLLGALAAYLGVESRRHLREADSSDEIVTAITALEPFMASSDPDIIAEKRAELADEVLVKNVRSRLSRRDAVRGDGLAPDQLEGLIDSIVRATRLAGSDNRPVS